MVLNIRKTSYYRRVPIISFLLEFNITSDVDNDRASSKVPISPSTLNTPDDPGDFYLELIPDLKFEKTHLNTVHHL